MRIAIRTLQRRPEILGENAEGEPIVEVDNVRLVLPHGARHFRHLVNCARCSREVVGDPVLSAEQLGRRREGGTFCSDCGLAMVGVHPMQAAESPEAAAGTEESQPTGPALERQPARAKSSPWRGRRLRSTEPPPERPVVGMAPHPPGPGSGPSSPLPEGLAEELEAMVGRRLEEGLQRLAAHLARASSATQRELLAQMSARADRRLEEQGARLALEVEAALTAWFDQSLHRLQAAVGTPTGREGPDVSSQVDAALTQLQQSQAQSLAEVVAALTGRLDEHRATVASEVAAALTVAQSEVGDRLAEQLQDLATRVETLADRLEAGAPERTALPSPPEGLGQIDREALLHQFEEDRRQLLSDVESSVGRLFDEAQTRLTGHLEQVMNSRLGQERQALASEVASALDIFLDAGVHQVEAAAARGLAQGHGALAADVPAAPPAVPVDHERLASDVAAGVEERLERDRQAVAAELQASLDRRLEEAQADLAGHLERAISARLDQERQALASVVQAALGERLDQQRQALSTELGARLAVQLEEGHEVVVSDVATAIGGRLEQQRHALTSDVEAALDRRLQDVQQEMIAQVGIALAGRLEEQHRVLASDLEAAIGARFERSMQELGSAVSGRLDQRARALTSDVGTALATHLAKASEELVSQLWTAVSGRLEQHRQALASEMAELLAERQELARLAADVGAAREQILERLDGVAAGAAESGTAAARAVGAMTDQQMAATAERLAGQMSEVQAEVLITRHSVAQLRRAVARLDQQLSGKELAAPDGGAELDALLPGLGMAAGFADRREPGPATTGASAKRGRAAAAKKAARGGKARPAPARKGAGRRRP